MKSILISIRPKWVERICHKIGKDTNRNPIYEKPIEVRKSKPSEVPFRGLIYATKPKEWYKCGAVCVSDESLWLSNGKVEMCDGLKFWGDSVEDYQCLNGKVIGEFICDKVYLIKNNGDSFSVADEEQSVTNEIARKSCLDYYDMVSYLGNKDGYGWHISDLKIYDKPKELSEYWGRIKCLSEHTVECWNCFAKCVERNGNHYQPITRPPQSWQYVEEIIK